MSGNIRKSRSFCFSGFSAVLLLLFPFVIVKAQGYGDRTGNGGGNNQNNSIQGRINFPSNAPAATIKIRLESPSSATSTTFSNSEGIFYFNGLYPGLYTVIVETGDDYEPVIESVSIDPEIIRVGAKTFNVVFDLRQKGSLKQTTGVISASMANVPKPAYKQFDKAFEAMNKGDNKLAADKFNEAIQIYPQFAEAYSELGTLYLRMGEIDKAAEALVKALQLNEKNIDAQLNYGIVLLNQKKMLEAEKQFEKTVLADENAPIPHLYLGISLIELNYPDYAEKEFLKTISLRDDEKLAKTHWYLGGIYRGKGKYKQAIEELEKYIKLVPKAADAEKAQSIIKQMQEKIK